MTTINYASIPSKAKIYLQCLSSDNIKDDNDTILVTIETFIILFVYKYLNNPKELEIYLIYNDHPSENLLSTGISISAKNVAYKLLTQNDYTKNYEFTSLCNFPVALTSDRIVIAGLCGVCRSMIKNQNNQQFNELLGFKGACLLSPSESSIWTKFCEIDIIDCVKTILNITPTNNESCALPEEMINFESHLSHPIRVHNVYKLARELATKEYKVQHKKNFNNFNKLSVNEVVEENDSVESGSNDASLDSKGMKMPRIKKNKVKFY